MTPKTRNYGTNALDAAILVTEGLKELAASAPVPALSGVVGLALHILRTAERLKTDRDACLRLANRAVEVTKEVHAAAQGKECVTDQALQANLDRLRSALVDIASWMERQGQQKLISRIIRRGKISEDLIDYMERLEDARHAFEVASLINLQHKVEGLEQRLESERLYDGEHRIFRRSEIRKLQMLGQDLDPDGRGIVWCSARVQGEVVVLKEYVGSLEQYEADTSFLKKAWHENVAQLIGHSHSNIEIPFQVVRCGTRTAVSYVEELEAGRHKTLEIARILCGIVDATAFLDKNDIGWAGWAHNVILDEEGTTAIGGHGDLTPATPAAVITIYQLQQRTSGFHRLLQDLFSRKKSRSYEPDDALQIMSQFWSYWCNSTYTASYSGEQIGDVGHRDGEAWVKLLSICDEMTKTVDHPTTLSGNATKTECLPSGAIRSCWEDIGTTAEFYTTSDGTHFTEETREQAWRFWLCNGHRLAEDYATYQNLWSPPLHFVAHPAKSYGGREKPWGTWSSNSGTCPIPIGTSSHENFVDEAIVYFIHLLPSECELLSDITTEIPGIVLPDPTGGRIEEVST